MVKRRNSGAGNLKAKAEIGEESGLLGASFDSKIKQFIADAVNSWKLENEKEIAALKAELVEVKKKNQEDVLALKTELADVKRSQTFISGKYEELKIEHNTLKKKSSDLIEKGANEDARIDSLEQYGRRQNLEIVGIPSSNGENTTDIVMKVADLIDVKISPRDISTSHRLKVKNKSQTPPIIVRFVSRDVRNEFYSKRKLIRNANLNELPVEGVEQVYINENLTSQRKRLFWSTKQKAKQAGFQYYWTSNGNIYARKSNDTLPIAINNNNDLVKIK